MSSASTTSRGIDRHVLRTSSAPIRRALLSGALSLGGGTPGDPRASPLLSEAARVSVALRGSRHEIVTVATFAEASPRGPERTGARWLLWRGECWGSVCGK